MSVDYSAFTKFADELANKYPVYALESAEAAMNDMADYLLEQVPEYPLETLGRVLPPDGISWLRTPKQRAWFFASIREDKIPGWKWIDNHPQKVGGGRTGNLGRAKGRDVTRNNESVVAVLGFDSAIAPYAPWVVGADYPGEDVSGATMYQAQIHVDRWWQFGSIIEENIEAGWNVFNETFWEEFSERIQK